MHRWFAFRRDLGLQLLALYLLLIIPFLVTLLVFDGLIGVRIREDVQASDLSLAQSISQEVELALTKALATVQGLAGYPEVIESEQAGMEEVFQVIINTSPDINLVYRLDDQYFFEDLCLVDGDLEVHDLHQLPSKTGDRELGQALLDALTRLPRVTLKEHINHERRELPGEAIIRSTRAYLFWDGIESPGRLSFAIVRPDASREAALTVSVNATAATVGKLVRSAFAKKMGSALRGLPHEELYQRLDRADFFEFCRRKATARSAFLKNGWQAAILEDVGRSFIADAEDLAEGGVGSLLRDMKPFFKSIGLETGRTRDDSREESYDVWLGDRCYPILVKDDFRKAAKGLANLWGMAGFRTATLLNFLLRKHGRKEQACSVSGGNEHWFLLITPEQHALLKRGRGYDKSSGPYHATGDAPNYGMIEY